MPLPRSVVSSVAIALVVAGVAARAAGEAQYRTAPPTRIAFEVFKKLYDRDAVLVLDVRAAESYRNGHVPGAILLPLGEVLSKVEELKKEKRAIVAYCAWPDEATSARAVLTLQEAGVTNVRALVGGWAKWVTETNLIVKGDNPR